VRKQVLYFIIVLALLLCMTLSMATLVMAGQISGTKHTIPPLPNIYYIGDTIYYETTVSNPGDNTATNYLTRIWDTMPDGTVMELLGASETLIQAPGDTNTFYTEYVVDWNDAEYSELLGYWIVSDTFQAQGYDSNGDDLYVLVTKNSQIIDPHIHVEKYVWDGVAWHDADTTTGPYLPSTQDPVIFKFDIDNDGIGDLNSVNLIDTDMSVFYTDQACTTLATFPIPTLYDDGPVVTVYGKLDFAAGQHSNNVTAVGTPPTGDPVSDSDPAHYFGSGPSIDVEKYVWDGVIWHDADTATGPYLTSAQNPVVFRFVITNNDNVNLTDVTLTDTDITTFYTNQACTTLATFPISTLTTSSSVIVYGKLAWTQGQHSNNATATGTPPVGADVSGSDTAHYFGSGPSIDVEKYVWDGVIWHDADTATGPYLTSAQNPVVFKFEIDNNGNVDLTSVNLADTHMSVFYTDQACTTPAVFPIPTITPSDPPVTVYGKLTWAQGQHTDSANATGTPSVGDPVSNTDPANYFGPPPSIDVEKYVWDGATWHDADTATGPYLTSAQNPVVFRFVITNNSGVNLISVNLTDTDMSVFYTDQACTIPATFPIATLTPSDPPVTVYGKLAWAEGQHSNNATANGTPPVGDPVSDSDLAHYYGPPPVPAIHIEKHTNGADADSAPGPYISVNETVTWTYIVTNTGAVNLTGIVVTDNHPGVTPIRISGDNGDNILQTTETWTYQATGVAVAGQYSNIGNVVGYYGAVEVSDSDPSHYYNRVAVGWETYPVNKVRVLLPWIVLLAAIVAGASLLVLRHRRARS
jgi:uncharacterized repeat protein (TIGR01451 family)